MTAITSSGEDSIRKNIEISPILNLSKDYEAYFEVDKCVKWIVDNGYQRVALQFPDELVHLTVLVYNSISRRIGSARVYVLADSTYGSCCIDEKTAAHINADALIHFGHSCGSSRKSKLPVLYVHVRPGVSIPQLLSDFKNIFADKASQTGILFDSEYADVAVELQQKLEQEGYSDIITLESKLLENLQETNERVEICRKIFFLTSTERSVINRILQVNKAFSKSNSDDSPPEISIYNPSKSSVIQTPSIQRLLMKRNYYIEKLREADVVGILVGTLSVDNYIEVIRHLKSILKQAGKKSYVVSIGEISAPKLANFPDINAFVLVACPETTLIESKEFYQVVVTPWEVEVAFGRQNDVADYFVDYRVLLPGSVEHIPFEKYSSRNIYADVSLINGVSRIGLNWQGLEELDAEEFKIHEGQSGIASYYSNEPQLS